MKKIYAAVNLDDAEFAKEEFREKWDKKYPSIMKSWDRNWPELTTFFEFPQEIRKLIYTTNAVERYHRVVRKFTKSKAIFFTDDSLRKVIYLSVWEISKKWTMPVRDWGVFTQDNSPDIMHPQSPTRYFKKFGQRYGIEDFHPHKLRHTSASLAITNGADVVSVSERVGHSDTVVTLRMYAHANEESIRRAGQIVRDALKAQGQ